MRSYNKFHKGRLAFTLIELLVVIGIIAILAGMVLAGVMTVRSKASVVKAKYEAGTIAAAITQYESDYGQPPVSQNVWASSRANNGTKDFTYGITTPFAISTYGVPTYKTTNAEVIAVLRNGGPTPFLNDLAATLNPKKKTYLDAPIAQNSISGGVGPDGMFRDPWGNPYIISLDLDSSGTTMDGFYGKFIETQIKPSNPSYPVEINGGVLVWSLGPDGTATNSAPGVTDPQQALRYGANKDNVLSWDK